MLAQRMDLFAGSGTAAARAAAKAAADAGREIIDLTAGEIWADLAPAVRDGAIAAIRRGVNRYTDTTGMIELREALAIKVGRETGQLWQADEIAVTSGAKQALFNAAMVLLDPGDEVLIPAPYWTTFPAQVLIAGGKPVFVDTRATGYVPCISDLAAAVTARTRAIVVNTPNNPTGAVYDRNTLVGIAEIALAHDLFVIFDQCYAAFTHGGHRHHPIVSLVPEIRDKTIIIDAFSKSLALTGWRVGYMAAPVRVVKAVRALQSHTTSNPNVIAQHAVLAHLTEGDGRYESELRVRLEHARAIGFERLVDLPGIAAPLVQGGFYFYLDLSGLSASSGVPSDRPIADIMVERLLYEAGVATVFGDPVGLRISYGVPPGLLASGLDRIVPTLMEGI